MMSLNQLNVSGCSEYILQSQRPEIKFNLHYGCCTGRRFTIANTCLGKSCSFGLLRVSFVNFLPICLCVLFYFFFFFWF